MKEGLKLNATARVIITKLDENGEVVGAEEREVELTEKEASELWHSLQQE